MNLLPLTGSIVRTPSVPVGLKGSEVSDPPLAEPLETFEASPVSSEAAISPKAPSVAARNGSKQGFFSALFAALNGGFGIPSRLDRFLNPPCDCSDCKKDEALPVWSGQAGIPLDFGWGKLGDAIFSQKMAKLEAGIADPEATIVSRFLLGGGINRTYVVELSNGAVGVWKTSAGQKMGTLRDRVEGGLEPQREAAAYLVDKAMGHYARVPPSVFRSLEGEEGSLTVLIPDAVTAKKEKALRKLAGSEDSPAYKRISLLDHVIGNLDRHEGNWLVAKQKDQAYDPEDAIPIDHGLSFPKDNAPQGGHNFAFDEDFDLGERERKALGLLKAARTDIEKQAVPLISNAPLEAMYQRVDSMLAIDRTSQEWRGVPSLGKRLWNGIVNPQPAWNLAR